MLSATERAAVVKTLSVRQQMVPSRPLASRGVSRPDRAATRSGEPRAATSPSRPGLVITSARAGAKLRTNYGPRPPNSARVNGQRWTPAISGSRSTTVEARSGGQGVASSNLASPTKRSIPSDPGRTCIQPAFLPPSMTPSGGRCTINRHNPPPEGVRRTGASTSNPRRNQMDPF
jgi:hypothetical protein